LENTRISQSSQSSGLTMADLIDRLSRFDGPPEQFLANLLAVQCLIAGAQAGAVLRIAGEGQMEVVAVHPQLPRGATAPTWLAEAAESAGAAVAGGSTAIKPVHSQEDLYGEPARRHLVLVPLRGERQVRGVEAFIVTGGDRADLAAAAQRLELSSSMLSLYEMRLTLQRRQMDMRRLRMALETLSAVNEHEKFLASAMALCNELCTRLGCDRVSLGLLRGRYVHVRAISHTEKFTRKMRLVQDIEAAMEECLDQDVEVVQPAPPEAAFVARAAAELSSRHGPLTILSLPLRQQGEPVGVITLERRVDQPFELEEVEALRLACDLTAVRVVNLSQTDRWFGARLAHSSRQALGGVLGPKHTWIKLVAILGCAFLAFAFLAKGRYRAESPFVIEAVQRQVVPAPYDGILRKVSVKPTDTVVSGQELAELDLSELQLQLASSKAERDGYLTEAAAAQRDSMNQSDPQQLAKELMAKANAARLDAQIGLLEYRISQGRILAPIDGEVITGDLERQIGAPVKTGDVLFEISPLTSLRADLLVGEDQVADLREGQTGELAAVGRPDIRIKLVVERINPVAEVVNQRNVFRVRAQLVDLDLLQKHQYLLTGMEGVAKVDIGRQSYAWLWSRRLVNWVRMKMWW
jgi:multidrug efflux pump subunit AcrA (membrane-fusion protein)